MTLAKLFLPELDLEMARTRAVLAAIPKDKFDWQPSDGLHTIGWNANHLAEIVGWTPDILEQDEFDIAPVDGPKYETPNINDPAELLVKFDAGLITARAVIGSTSDDQFARDWTMKMGGQSLFTISKGDCIRTWVLNHSVHHRGILSVYLRMCGVELTPVYDG